MSNFLLQVSDLKQESKDMEPKLEQLNETSSTKRVTMEELSAQKSEKVDNCKNEEEIVGMLKKEVDDLKSNSDRELMEVKEKVEGNHCLNLRLFKFSYIISENDFFHLHLFIPFSCRNKSKSIYHKSGGFCSFENHEKCSSSIKVVINFRMRID